MHKEELMARIRAGEAPITRRRFMQGSALVGVSAFLVACGTEGTDATPTPGNGATPGPTPDNGNGEPSTVLNFANWPLYIDRDDDVGEDDETRAEDSATLRQFTEETGITVNYSEVINSNEEFFGTVRAPLQAGQDTGWDLIVPTQWMAARLVRLGWAERLDLDSMENYPENLEDVYKGVDFDANNEYHAVWQAGLTGLGFDSEVTGELTSSAALWDSQWAGRVTYLSEMRDAVGITLQKLGYDPENFTDDQFDEAIAELQRGVDDGIVRAFTGNEYSQDLVAGNVVLAMAWSGDILQLQYERESLQFALPDEGGSLWYDTMVVPKGAQHKDAAERFIDFYYQPEVAAQVEAWVNFICPVVGAREALMEIDEELAENELIFPTDEMLARAASFKSLSEDEEQRYNDAFSQLVGV
jgi:spermidine/putrescine transport system substrate-binding protein